MRKHEGSSGRCHCTANTAEGQFRTWVAAPNGGMRIIAVSAHCTREAITGATNLGHEVLWTRAVRKPVA